MKPRQFVKPENTPAVPVPDPAVLIPEIRLVNPVEVFDNTNGREIK
jgi:hypothetical protein